ncbi:carbohydrate ABC transporter permease [Vibrio sp. S9_S30]|uniref:carbohydrate ABC transporter permease n=1 Tax=Vibrio sp. S9_S30 TaxID=2720226 RepID=UPI001680CFB6|nr:carbohydrate ABC transporter permease [Vibrio sp. S9_S30]MBD1558188.1 carbohydrate ABC transporter permease [Vibrio sp. S9_S30]
MSRFSIHKWISIVIAVIWSIFPLYWLLKYAFLTPAEIAAYPPPFFPESINVASFYNVIGLDYTMPDGTVIKASGQANQILAGLWNSAVVSFWSMIITLIVVIPLAYVFARLEFRFKTPLLMAVLLSVAIPPVSTLIPFYVMFTKLGLTGTKTGLVIVTLTITIPFVTWMLIGYFRNLPQVEKLARIDGFSRLGTFIKIIIPLSKSGIAVAAVIAFLFSWNEFVFATILANGTPATTLPAAVSGFLFQQPQPSHMAAAIWITILPAVLVVYFLQRHITEMNIVDPI